MTPATFGIGEEDTRKVQTAVRGGPDSAVPAFLPYEKDAASRLREDYGPNAFSCGVLLGGCGKLLTLRACDDKKSHFAHRPPVRCARTARGESSADHLYIGEALSEWLRRQGRPGVTVQYVRQKDARSDSVEIRFGTKKKRGLIHVQMARRSFNEWRDDAERFAAPDGRPPTVRTYGPDSQLAAYELEAGGYALRFRCETAHGTRVVHIGTHLPGHRVEWTTLDRCRLVKAGILTPWLTQTPSGLRPRGAEPLRSAARPAAEGDMATPAGTAPASSGPLLPLVPGSIAFTGATLSSRQSGRRIYDADAQAVGSSVFHARICLPGTAAAPEPDRVYALTDRAVVLGGPRADDAVPRWILRAEGFVRLTPAKAAEWDLPGPSGAGPARDDAPAAAPMSRPDGKQASAAAASGTSTASGADPAAGSGPGPATVAGAEPAASGPADDALVAKLGRVLLRTARDDTTITWPELLQQIGVSPQDIGQERRLRLLTAVDAPHAEAHRPLLSSLITFSSQAQPDDHPPQFFRAVLLELGWPRHTDVERAAVVRREHRGRLHRAYASRPERHEEREQVFRAGDLPAPRPGERPQGRLLVLLRHLDARGAELSFLDLYRLLEEADRLASRIGEGFLADATRERLHHWRTVFRRHRGAPATARTADQEVSEAENASDVAARAVFDRMADEFRAARDAGDLALAKRIRGGMGPVYALRLSPRDRAEVTDLVRDFKQWVRDQSPKPFVDPPLKSLRAVLHDLGTRRSTLATGELVAALAEIDRLCGRLAAALPEAERRSLGRWRGNLRHRLREEGTGGAHRPPGGAVEDAEDRGGATDMPMGDALRALADRVRAVLQDTARDTTTITWADLCRRTAETLSRLGVDDRVAVLVAADRDTPADEPLLTSLITDAGHTGLSAGRLHRSVRRSLGRSVPDAALEMHRRMDILRLHQLWPHR